MIADFGSINLDLIANTSRLPQPGETISGRSFETAAGGKGANQALAAARAGAGVKMFGAVGTDAMAAQALSQLGMAQVDLSGVRKVEGSTGIAMILVDAAGENVIVVVPGANGALTEDDAKTCVENLASGDILMLQQEIPPAALRAVLSAAKEAGVRTMLNIAPFTRQEAELVHDADIIVANETEFAQLLGFEFAPDQAEKLAFDWARTHKKTLAITLGSDGAVAATPDEVIAVEALKIEPVDTVGAGDTFCGYLAAGLHEGLSLEAALRRAAIAGSLACLKPGAQPSIPTLQDVLSASSKG